MKIALFGGTGHIGQHVLRLALAQGHQLTVFVRNRSRLPPALSANCHVLAGSLESPTSVRYALEGCDAVIVTLAAGHSVLEAFDTSALPVLKLHGPKRIVSMVGASVRMPGDPDSFRLRLMAAAMHLVPGGLLRDAQGHARRLAASGLDWTLIRSSNFSSAPATGRIRVTTNGDMPLSSFITHEDLAAVILETATTGRYLGQSPMVCNG